MAAPILDDKVYGTTPGSFFVSGLHDQSVGLTASDQDMATMLRTGLLREKARRSGTVCKTEATGDPPKVVEFERLLDAIGADLAVVELVEYLDEAAREHGLPFLREWLKEAAKEGLSEDLCVATLAMLRPVRSQLPEYTIFLTRSRERLLDVLPQEVVSALLRAYE